MKPIDKAIFRMVSESSGCNENERITLDMKHTGKPSAGNLHAGFDAAGAGTQLTLWLVRRSPRKRRATASPDFSPSPIPGQDWEWREPVVVFLGIGIKRRGQNPEYDVLLLVGREFFCTARLWQVPRSKDRWTAGSGFQQRSAWKA